MRQVGMGDEVEQLHEPQADLWKSISKIIELQNKAPALVSRDVGVKKGSRGNLSFSQERVLWSSKLRPKSTTHNLVFCYRIGGMLDPVVFNEALTTIVERHSVLRTIYDLSNPQPEQVVESVSKLVFKELDSDEGSLEGVLKDSQFLDFIEKPFDLEVELPIRGCLHSITAEDNVILIVIHHIAFDGWSEGLFFTELSECYARLKAGLMVEHQSLGIQYIDYARWQRSFLTGPLVDALREYWDGVLSEGVHLPELPIQCTTLNGDSIAASLTVEIKPEVSDVIKNKCKNLKITGFVFWFTTFQILLSKYCDQTKLSVCSPVANRNKRETRDLIGYFVNLIFLQTDFGNFDSFSDALKYIKSVVSGAFAHQDLPFENIVQRLKSNQGSFARVLFAFQNTPQSELTILNANVQRLDVGSGSPDFELFISILEYDGRLRVKAEFDGGLYSQEFIATFLDHYVRLVELGAREEDFILSELHLWDEHKQLEINEQRSCRQLISQEEEVPSDRFREFNFSEAKMADIWQKFLGVRPKLGENFFDIGGQSIVAVQVMEEVALQFGKKLPLSLFLEKGTIEDFTEAVESAKNTQKWPVIVRLRDGSSNDKPIFFGVHGVGGTTIFYRAIAESMKEDFTVYGFQSLGLDGIQKPLDQVEDMAHLYLKELKKIQPKGPYIIAGYSFGGFIALEMAQQLRKQGEDIAFLGMIDAPTPDVANRKPSFWDIVSTHFINILNEERGKKWKYVSSRLEWLRNRGKAKKTDYENQVQKENPGIKMFRVLNPNYRASERYLAKPYEGAISVFRAKTQTTRCAKFSDLGWSKYSSDVDVYDVPGGHYTMIKEPNVKHLALSIDRAIRKIN
jgi:thioesterase domain-containing protein